MARDPLVLHGDRLTLAGILDVARRDRPVALAPEALARMREARGVVERHLAEDRPVYGLTTGLGPRVTERLDRAAMEAFSRQTVLGRANGVGPLLDRAASRAVMLIRANTLALGGAGASPAIAEFLIATLNAGIHPIMPSIGSVGAADLCLMGHLGLLVIGEGEAAIGAKVLPALEALAGAGIAPLTLGPKDGLALCSSNAVSAALGALCLSDARAVFELAQLAAALTFEGFRANLSPLDPRIQAARPSPGQAEAASGLLRLLAESALNEPGAARRVQDPLSLRCVAPVHGALLSALDFAAAALEPELNGAGDNPLVLVEDGEILSNGNFHTTSLALAFDALGLALTQSAQISAARIERMLSATLTGLPACLSPPAANGAGFAPASKTAQALLAQIRGFAAPASIHVMGAGEGVEDDASNAPLAVSKTAEMLWRIRLVLSLELMMGAQAVDLRGGLRLGRGPAIAHRLIREIVPPLAADRPLGAEIDRLERELLASGRLLAVVKAG